MDSCILFSVNFLTVSKYSRNEFWHENKKDLWIPVFQCQPIVFNEVKSQPLVDDGFSMGLAFAAGFSEAFSSSWIGMASLTNLSIPFTILIQDSVWCLNKDWALTSILYLPYLLQTFMSETGPNITLLWIHPRSQWPILTRSWVPCPQRWRSLSTMGWSCRWRSHLPLVRERVLLLQEQMVAAFK